ncbi:glycine-rich domain-containing protein, partial [Aestuariibius insulae]|uniref:glycine-rich domain-containing protein n=1 Tax=Aestuariibius insulae TaxID=2058287 RepID=UPI00398F1411
KAWADQEPDWRCDLLVRGNQRIGQLVSTICAAGRARDTFIGTKSGVVRETAGQPVEALLTPRNTRGEFRVEHRKVDDFHALRVKAVSERLEWQEDEIIVYRDGYSFETASKFLDLSLIGTVIGENEENAGNAWKLARYFMAELLLRPEEIQIPVDLHHLALRIGSKFRFQHDVRLNGVGSGRILEITSEGASTRLTLDEALETPVAGYRLSVWNTVSELVTATAVQDRPPTSVNDWWPYDVTEELAIDANIARGGTWSVPSNKQSASYVLQIQSVEMPSVPLSECLAEVGGFGSGFAVFVDGDLLVVQAGQGTEPGATGQARIEFDYSAFRGHSVDLTVEIDTDLNSLRLWIGRRLVASELAIGGAYLGGRWTAGNVGHYLSGFTSSMVAGAPRNDWTGQAGDLLVSTEAKVPDPVRGPVWICDRDISADIEPGDLTVIERVQDAERDLIVTRIVPEADGQATLYAVDAAPEILQADQGPIPTYDPDINTDLIGLEAGPSFPKVLAIRSNLATAIVRRATAVPLPRIGVATRPPTAQIGRAVSAQIRWRKVGDGPWTTSAILPWAPEIFTDPVQEGASFEAEIQFLDDLGRTRGFVPAGILEASVAPLFIFPPSGWTAKAGIDTVTLQGNASINEDFAEFRAYALTAAGQPEVFVAASAAPVIVLRPDPAIGATGYVIREALNTGALSNPTPFLPAVPTGVAEGDLVNPLRDKIEDARTTAHTAIAEIDVVEANVQDVVSLGAVTLPGGEISSLKLVSYDDPTGAASAALQFDGQLIIDGTVGSSALVVSDFSGNLVRDAPFFSGDARPWDVRSAQIELVEGQISDGYPDKHVLRFPVNPSNLRVIVEPSTPCEAGAFYSVRFPLFCAGSCRLLVSFQFKKATGGTFTTRLVGPSAGSFPAWTVFEGQVQAPAEAVSMRIDIVRAAHPDDVGEALFGRAIVRRKATANTVILPGSIKTDLLDVQNFQAAQLAVFGGSLQSDNFQPLPNLTGFQINQDGSAFFGSNVTIGGALKRSAFAGGELTVPIEPLDIEFIEQSTTDFRFKRPGLIDLYVVGGGGSGGAAVADLGVRQGVAGGGSAGGCVRQYIIEANTTDSYTVTIGAGGAAVSQSGNGATFGQNGNRSRFQGAGLDLIANGGRGGRAATSQSLPVEVSGVSGGTASGGDGNFRGGDAGGALCTVDGDLGAASSGGALSFNLLNAVAASPGAVNGAGDDGKPIPDILDGVQSSPIPFLRMGDGYNFQGGNARLQRNGSSVTKGGNGRLGTGGGGAVANGDSGVAAQAESGEGGRGFVIIFYRGGLDLAGGS